ncbi:MAG: hypothetical protein ACK5WZ_15745 [Pseudobdellovibrionaceae bacterium]
MKSQKALYQFAIVTGAISLILLQSACTGGGFNAQDAKLNKSLEILINSDVETPTKAESVPKVPPGNQELNPLVDLSSSPEVLQQDLSVLMNQENQIVEVAMPSMMAFEAGSNINQDISKIWKAGELKVTSFENASSDAVETKSNFCSVSGFAEIKGSGTVTHRMMQVETADAGTGLKSAAIHFTSYLAGMGAGDEANGWTIRCFGSADSFKVNLQLLKDAFGTNLETEVVGPQ